jgi:hypothetical protein
MAGRAESPGGPDSSTAPPGSTVMALPPGSRNLGDDLGQFVPGRTTHGVGEIEAVRLDLESDLADRTVLQTLPLDARCRVVGVGELGIRRLVAADARKVCGGGHLNHPLGSTDSSCAQSAWCSIHLPENTDKVARLFQPTVMGGWQTSLRYCPKVFCIAPARTFTAGPPLPDWQTFA